jgi:hypothetical protein
MVNVLDSAIAELRQATSRESLSEAGRARIVAEAWRQQQDQPGAFEPSTRPARWVGWMAAFPIAASVLVALAPDRDAPSTARFARVDKVGDEVVFHVANGNADHKVTRSTDPSSFNPKAEQDVSDGRYSDRANSGPVVVFYKLD